MRECYADHDRRKSAGIYGGDPSRYDHRARSQYRRPESASLRLRDGSFARGGRAGCFWHARADEEESAWHAAYGSLPQRGCTENDGSDFHGNVDARSAAAGGKASNTRARMGDDSDPMGRYTDEGCQHEWHSYELRS